MNKAIDEIFEDKKEDAERGETISFAYFLFPAYTEEMVQNEWLNREEFEERVKELKSQETKISCEEDHETFSNMKWSAQSVVPRRINEKKLQFNLKT